MLTARSHVPGSRQLFERLDVQRNVWLDLGCSNAELEISYLAVLGCCTTSAWVSQFLHVTPLGILGESGKDINSIPVLSSRCL